jgi:hypothetical protein
MIKIILGGQELDLQNDVTGEGLTRLEIRDSDAESNRVKSVTQSYTLTGAAYELVAALFIDNLEGKVNEMPVLIYESGCCDNDVLIFEGRLISDNVKWCHKQCSCDVLFEEYTTETAQMDCLKSTLIHDPLLGFREQQHPRMVYCVDLKPDVLQYFVFLVGAQMNLALFVLYPIVFALQLLNSVLGGIESVINSIPGVSIDITFDFDGNSATNILQEYQNLINLLNENIVGCGRAHPSPLARDYIKNVCDICGLTFQSSILNSPSSDYYNMVVLFAPMEKGSRNDNVFWINGNELNQSGDMFLDSLKPVFNAKWEIRNSTLFFERKDFFDNGDIFVNYADLEAQNLIGEKLCLEWRDELRPAYLKCEYQLDALDVSGNEARAVYNEIIEWNTPYSSLQSGSRDVLLQFAPNRFRNDGVAPDTFQIFENIPIVGIPLQGFRKVMTLQKHVTMLPRLIIWDGVSRVNGLAKRYEIPTGFPNIPGLTNTTDTYVNFPLMFNEFDSQPQTAYPSNRENSALYQRFYAWENPRLFRDLGKQFEFSFRYNCEQLQQVLNAQYVGLPLGDEDEIIVGRVTQMTVNLQESTITIIGNV